MTSSKAKKKPVKKASPKKRVLFLSNLKSSIAYYFKGLYNRIDEHHSFLYSGGLAFSIFTCIIPFILILFYILGYILTLHEVEDQIVSFIQTVIPYEEYATYVRDIIFSRIKEVVDYKNLAGWIGAFGLLITASGLFSSMRTILNKIFLIKDDKPVWWAKLRDFAQVIATIVLVFLSTAVIPTITIVKELALKFDYLGIAKLGFVENLLIEVVPFFLIWSIFFIFYSYIPYERLGKKVAGMSALWAAIMWEAAKLLFGMYISRFASIDKIYGAYALLVVVAFWIYYSCLIFIIGAEIGQLYREKKALQNNKKES